MDRMLLSQAAKLLQGRLVGEDRLFATVSSDTRTLRADDLFIALVGPNFDAHNYLDEARNKGACAALVSRQVDCDLPQIVVADTRLALGRLGAGWRSERRIPVIGITGSNGKTTVKEMIAAIMGKRGSVLATRGNLNNDIGVPLTLLRLRDAHQAAVIEMGANHAGEIAYMTALVQPTVALITNAGPAHLEGFGSIEGVAHAKGEIYAGLQPGGIAVINADDVYAPLWRGFNAGRAQLSFGIVESADVRARPDSIVTEGRNGDTHTRFMLDTPDGSIELSLPLPGRHNVMNALAATAACLAAGATLEHVRGGLAAMQPVSGRLQARPGAKGAHILDDTYNANPASLQAALDVLMAMPGVHWLVLGDMGELGADSEALHAEMGKRAAAAGIDRLFAIGKDCRAAARAAGACATHFDKAADLIAAVRAELHGDVTVLVKGSRFMHMEQVVEGLQNGHRPETVPALADHD